jgi:hypothetical protein
MELIMGSELDGARLKVVRAKVHLKSLKAEIAKYAGSSPHEVVIEIDGDSATGRLAIKHEPPLMLSCIIGDCVSNLRAALDYIAWQLAGRYAGRALIPGRDKPFFPIQTKGLVLNPDAIAKLAKYNIPAKTLSRIKSVQPYRAGYEPLFSLERLVNEDKHRLPLLAVGSAWGIKMSGKGGSAFCNGNNLTVSLAHVAFGTIGPLSAQQKTEEMEVKGETTLFVTLKNPLMPGGAIDWQLENIINCVAKIVRKFDAEFV